MKPVIEFSECLFDSPKFRTQLGKNEGNLDDLEGKLERILKLENTINLPSELKVLLYLLVSADDQTSSTPSSQSNLLNED